MMINLIKKDCRVNLATILGGAIMVIGAYVVATIVLLCNLKGEHPFQGRDIFALYYGTSICGLWIAALMAAGYGGVAFAVERRERSADFLAMLPVTRTQIIFSKTLVGITGPIVLWAINGYLAALLVDGAVPTIHNSPDLHNHHQMVAFNAISLMMVFGISWLFSTVLTSPTISFCLALGIGLGSNLGLATWADHAGYTSDEVMRMVDVWSLSLGVISYLAGSIYYLRRIAP